MFLLRDDFKALFIPYRLFSFLFEIEFDLKLFFIDILFLLKDPVFLLS